MIREASSLPAGTTIECDVCVIGAGPAGIVMALDLAQAGRRVCLLESGGDALQSAIQALHRGADGTQEFLGNADYVWSSRLRFLGGTSNHWEGECETLTPGDLTARAWIPHSGWPLDFDSLAEWYARAAPWLELPDGSTVATDDEDATAGFAVTKRHWSGPTRFGPRYREALAAAPNVDLILRASVTALEANESGSRLERVAIAAVPGGDAFSVRARHTVLATGALENARLLLASPQRLGNTHDRVGRYFMDGIEGRVAEMLVLRPEGPMPADDVRSQRVVAPSLAMQRDHELLNTRFRLEPVPVRATGFVGELGSLIASIAGGATGGRTTPTRPGISRVIVGTEMAPNPDNRVHLSDETDALGVPRLSLDAAPGALELESITRATQQFATTLGASLSGRLRIEIEPEDPWSRLSPAQHPSGTTRMHSDPAHGVVDADCRVHGVANLFVAGSSVFPTCGRARPTWTLVALALRLAEHLSKHAEGAA